MTGIKSVFILVCDIILLGGCMKKLIILLLALLTLVGCSDKKETKEEKNNDTEFILEKNDNDKDFVYLSDYKTISYDNNDYKLQNLTINIKSDDVENINLELKSFVVRAFKDMEFKDNKLIKGKVISYDWNITDNYVSVIQRYYPYINGIIGEEEDNVYVISLDSGNIMNNKELLKDFDLTEEEIYDFIDKHSDLDDVEFTKMNIKNNGYKLYVKDNKLNIIYYEIDDTESIRKELVLN